MNLIFDKATPWNQVTSTPFRFCGVRVIAQGERKSSKLGGIHHSKWDIIAGEICETLPMTHVQRRQISGLIIYTESIIS